MYHVSEHFATLQVASPTLKWNTHFKGTEYSSWCWTSIY